MVGYKRETCVDVTRKLKMDKKRFVSSFVGPVTNAVRERNRESTPGDEIFLILEPCHQPTNVTRKKKFFFVHLCFHRVKASEGVLDSPQIGRRPELWFKMKRKEVAEPRL